MTSTSCLRIISLAFVCLSAPFAYASNTLSLLPVAKIKYYGVCDGSAGLIIDPHTLLVANDENNILISYDIWGGKPIASADLFTLLPNLELDDDKDKELDIEAAAIFENQIWWIASHGRNKSGKARPNRRSFFATNIPNRNLENLQLTSPRIDLASLFKASSKLNGLVTGEVLEKAPKKGGFNIEAMTFTSDGKLLIGLRSPLNGKKGRKGDATLVTLEYVSDSWQIKESILLDLKGKGIRDIIRTSDGYTLIAGDVAPGGTFLLYTLDKAHKPSRLATFDPNTLNPETLVALNRQLLVLNDDGSTLRATTSSDGVHGYKTCKDLMGKNVDQASDDLSVFFRGTIFAP